MSTTGNFATYQATRHFASLDGLRCLSILGVIWHHTGAPGYPSVPLLQNGGYGVWLFFAISGFLITTLLLREKRRNGFVAMKNFIIRRALRIFPLYYTVLIAYVVLVRVLEHDSIEGREFLRNLKFYLSYSSNWGVPFGDGRVIFYFAWSLAVEEQFYMVWPWAEKYLRPVGAGLLMLVVCGAALHFGQPPFAAIGCGVLLAHVIDSERGFRWAFSVLGRKWSAPLALCLVLILIGSPRAPLEGILVAMTLLVGATTIREDHLLQRPLTLTPIVRTGQISYGMYLLHMLTANVVKRGMAAAGLDFYLLDFIATTSTVIVVAQLSFTYYESIFLRMKVRYAA